MGFVLCTAEKPSVAKDIASVLGAHQRRDGYFEGNGYLVTWCIGHLVSLSYPESYDEKYTKWSIDNLPIIPTVWKTEVIKSVASQYKVVKELMHRKDVELIIDCGDAGTEGCYIQELVRRHAGCNKPVKRLWISSLTKEAILEGFKNLRDIREFDNIYKAASCRAKADWLVGLNATRLFTCKYGTKLTCGRVQTPTLAFVVQRFLEVQNFVPSPYYQLQASFTEGISALWTNDTTDRFETMDEAARMLDRLKGYDGCITKLETKRKSVERPLLYDITELQREGNRKYGYSAETVLKAAQSLYEVHKITTYPRTDSRYLSSDMEPVFKDLIGKIGNISKYSLVTERLLQDGLLIDSRIINDSKITDHHAIVITNSISGFDFSKLNDIESNILHLVISRMLVITSPKYVYDETNLCIDINGEMFVASGKQPVTLGWKGAEKCLLSNIGDENNEANHTLTNLKQGQTVHIDNLDLHAKKTQPPRLHTEETLLTAMENAGNSIKDDAVLKEALKGHGIGTQATRAGIIEKLISCRYIQRGGKGKTPNLIPTKTGLNFFAVIPRELLSPRLTAEWEVKLSKIAQGQLSEDVFMEDIHSYVKNLVSKNSTPQKDDKIFDSNDSESLGDCPRCGQAIFEGKANFYCNGYKNDPKCSFVIWKNDKFIVSKTGREISVANAKRLLEGKGVTSKCKGKNGEYKARFTLKDTGKYIGFSMEFINERKK